MQIETSTVLQPFVDRHELAGAVTLVADKNQILSCEAVGYADVAQQKPLSTDAVFWIASQTKPITATALLMLVEAGLANIDDAVEKYLPEFKGQMVIAEQDEHHTLLRRPSHPMTVGNVLSHTGGMMFITPVEVPNMDNLSLRDACQLYALLPLQFEPDSQYLYSNVGINIAGRIIEVVSGGAYHSFLQERLFTPLEMKDTTFWPNAEQQNRLCKTVRPDEQNELQVMDIQCFQYPLDDPKRFATPGGGLFSTSHDVARFCQMILRGGELDGKRYLSDESIRQMTRRHTAPNLESYGLGWSVRENAVGHGGAYGTNMTIDWEKEIALVYMVQHAGFPGDGASAHQAFRDAVNERFS